MQLASAYSRWVETEFSKAYKDTCANHENVCFVLFCFVYKYFISLKRGACLPHMNELRTFCGVIHKSLTATVKYFLMIFDVVV